MLRGATAQEETEVVGTWHHHAVSESRVPPLTVHDWETGNETGEHPLDAWLPLKVQTGGSRRHGAISNKENRAGRNPDAEQKSLSQPKRSDAAARGGAAERLTPRYCLLRDRLDPPAHIHVAGPAAIDGARRVSRNALRHVGARRDLRNERHHLAVLGAADSNALLEAGIDLAAVIARLMVGRIDVVVAVDVEPAWAPELLPLLKELAVLIEDLDAVVDAVSHEQPASRIHGELMRRAELARTAAALAPGLDEGAVLGELENAVIGARAVSLRHEDVAVRRHEDVGRLIERVGGVGVAGDARLAQRHQHFAVLAELDDGLALAILRSRVGYPDVAFAVDMEAVRIVHRAGAELGLQVAVGVELHDRIERRAAAVVRGTTVERPETPPCDFLVRTVLSPSAPRSRDDPDVATSRRQSDREATSVSRSGRGAVETL